MIGTMTDEQIKNKIEKYEGAQLLALFMALYHFHINEHKLKEEVYEMIKAKVLDRLNYAEGSVEHINQQFVSWAKDHYWGSLEKDRDLIIKHIKDNFPTRSAIDNNPIVDYLQEHVRKHEGLPYWALAMGVQGVLESMGWTPPESDRPSTKVASQMLKRRFQR